MVIPVRVEISGDAPYLPVRSQRAVLKGAYHFIGETWLEDYLPLHFKPFAARRYGYAKRTERTKEKKKRLAERGRVEDGGRQPLVWSGLLRRSLLEHHHTVRAYPSRATAKLIGPSYLSIRYKSGRPNIGREILATTTDERRKLEEAGGRRLEHLIRQDIERRTSTKTIKG